MKKQNALRKFGILLAGTFMFAVLFSACKKSEVVHTPVAGLMAVNLVPDQQAIGIAVDNNAITNIPLPYTNYTGNYVGVYAGNRTLTSYNFNTGTTLASGSEAFADSAYYSLFVVGTEGNYQNIFVQDKLDSLPTSTGNAFVRYVNAVTGSENSNVTVNSGATVVFNDANKTGTVSSFQEVTPGSIDVAVTNEGNTFNATRSIDVAKDGIYTVLLTGMPTSTDTTTEVKIRVIKNGNLTP